MRLRPHTSSDHAALAELRWLFRTCDGRAAVEHDKGAFIERYRRHLVASDRDGCTVHLVADDHGTVVGVMTLRIVPMEPSPGDECEGWGYLTNAYVAPDRRNHGIGTRLLEAICSVAVDRNLELLIVWPSEASYGFYRHFGFEGRDDPLVLKLPRAQR